ncbi:MAG TPA: transglycosylase SLT domain-containing protein [Candidatus Binataceae bacterium]|nr:transglycosylase SLT domain-containing protein [Candidatus Binataceae bacterium]
MTVAVAALIAAGLSAQLTADDANPARARTAPFRDGYRAWQRRDFAATIAAMRPAATQLPALADYALFYLGAAQAASNDWAAAAASYRHLATAYPESVLAETAEVEYARMELKVGQPAVALAAARSAADRAEAPANEQDARLLVAQAALAQGDFQTVYDAAQRLRAKYPRGVNDSAARALAYGVLAQHPGVEGAPPLSYSRGEAGLLIREGEFAAALAQVTSALALGPSAAERIELFWMRAEATRGDEDAARAALTRYLAIAPAGAHAVAALNRLAHSYWRSDDTAQARLYFQRVAALATGNEAAEAMYEIGRIYEDDAELEAARREYLQIITRYAASEAAELARFRAPFLQYMQGNYAAAAAGFAAARRTMTAPADRDGAAYWLARSLERRGEATGAEQIYRALAVSTASNYYPSLASRKVGLEPVSLALAGDADTTARAIPESSGTAQFHLTRIAALREVGLRELEAPELRAIADINNLVLRRFLLAEMQEVGAWYDAIQLANTMAADGEIASLTAERVRYPRGFWELISGEAGRGQLDPWLVAALIRQESLYNPQARSSSDARGLMQLLPSTAEHWAPAAGLSSAALDLYDPNVSVRIGTTYLKGLFEMFDGDPFKAVAAYNGGEHAVAAWNRKYPGDDDQWVENIEYRETREYVKKVIGGQREYRLLYAPAAGAVGFPPRASAPG